MSDRWSTATTPDLLRRHVADRAHHVSGLRVARSRSETASRRGHRETAATGFARPKSRILTRSSRRDEDVVGLQVPMDDPLFVGRGEAQRDLHAVFRRLAGRAAAPSKGFAAGSRLREAPIRRRRRSPRAQSRGSRGCSGATAPRPLSPLVRSAHSASGSSARRSGSTFTATVRSEPRVPRLVHLPHPARAQRRQDLVGAEVCSGGDAHRLSSAVQSRTTVIGGETRLSGSVTTRKRCPSGVTA